MFHDLIPYSPSSFGIVYPLDKGKYDGKAERNKNIEHETFRDGHSLYQELFFFCTVKNVGDIPGAGCIYVETVVDRNSGIAFAKVYPSKNTMNAVDILKSRVIPFFKRQDAIIKEIHTRNTSEYCGLTSVHPFEIFLANSQIQHLPKDQPGHPDNYLCEQFYRLLLKNFFLPALRMKYELSLSGLQRGLDKFVENYNAERIEVERVMNSAPHPSPNFPVDL
jgi:transposase InsO family protein